MKFIYTVLIDDDEAVICSSIRSCKQFISEVANNEPVHKFSIYNTETGTTTQIKIKGYNKMKKQELFEKAIKAMDNYTKSVEMGLSDFANYYHCRVKELCNEIRAKGLYVEFEEFALVC